MCNEITYARTLYTTTKIVETNLSQVEVSGEPSFDASVLAHDFNKFAVILSRVVQPAAAVDNVVLLQHAQTAAHGRSVCEHKNTPSVLGLALLNYARTNMPKLQYLLIKTHHLFIVIVIYCIHCYYYLYCILKPFDLSFIDENFMRSVPIQDK